MSTINQAFTGLAVAVIADPTLSRGDAGAVIEAFGPDMRGSEARQWLDAMAVLYESLGIINNATWGNFRNEIVNEGLAVATNLFDNLIAGIQALPETIPVQAGITREDQRQQLAEVTTSLNTFAGFQVGATEQVLGALQLGINGLEDLKFQLETQLGV